MRTSIRKPLVVVATFLLTVTVFISTTAMSTYTPLGKGNGNPNGYPPPPGCLSISFFNVVVNGTNNFYTIASATNHCGSTVTSGLIYFTVTDNCSGIGSKQGYGDVSFGTLNNGATSSRLQGYWFAGCAICDDGVIVSAPPFTITATAYATGYVGTTFIRSNTSAPISKTLSNSISGSAPLCEGMSSINQPRFLGKG